MVKDSDFSGVALRKESVDRNFQVRIVARGLLQQSLSARRAWIETLAPRLADMSAAWSLSARRAWIETIAQTAKKTSIAGSLSARRAWIETMIGIDNVSNQCVALRKESVDRNHVAVHCVALSACRSPQGERG